MFLINSRSHLVFATSSSSSRKDLHLPEAHLLPKLRCHFAEFLHPSYLKALVFSTYPPVSVWGTVLLYLKLRDFSWKPGINHLVNRNSRRRRTSELIVRICQNDLPKYLNHHNHRVADLTFSVIPSQHSKVREY